MPRLLEVNSRTDALLLAACQIIGRVGVRGLTLRAVAAESRVSPAAIVHHFGGRARMDRVLGRTFGHRWMDELQVRARERGLGAFVPADHDEVEEARVWQAWLELARADVDFASNLAGVRASQRSLLSALSHRELDVTDLDLLVAVVEGLRSAACAPADPLPPERALTALDRHVAALRSSA